MLCIAVSDCCWAAELAAACGTTRQTVHTRFGTREQLQTAIVRAAFKVRCREVMAQAAACNHPLAARWSVTIQPKSTVLSEACDSKEVDL